MPRPVAASLPVLLLLLPLPASGAGKPEFGGFFQWAGQFYPAKPNPSDAHANGVAQFQLWTRVPLGGNASLRGTWDFRLDTHRDVDRSRWLDVSQRGARIPAGSLSECYLDFKLGRVDVRAGKQSIRWGRADGFNPTDNLIPYDYLDTFADVRIAVPALKIDTYAGDARFEFAWVPINTPTRLPLAGQRWYPQLPATVRVPAGPGGGTVELDATYHDAGRRLPARTVANGQWGVRWNQLIPGAEFSLSYFDGFDDLPFFRAGAVPLVLEPRTRLRIDLLREYYRVRVAGADFAASLGPFGVRAEAAWFDQSDPANRDHLLFVIGVDRSWGDWFAVVQYAGQKLSRDSDSDSDALFPDLALRSTLLWRLDRTIGPSRKLELEGAVRLRDGDFLAQASYVVSLTNKWRLRLGASAFGGARDAYLGRFRDNGVGSIELRYSF